MSQVQTDGCSHPLAKKRAGESSAVRYDTHYAKQTRVDCQLPPKPAKAGFLCLQFMDMGSCCASGVTGSSEDCDKYQGILQGENHDYPASAYCPTGDRPDAKQS